MKKLLIFLPLLLLLHQACAPAKALQSSSPYQKGYHVTYRQKTVTETNTVVMGATQNQLSTNTVDYRIDLADILADGSLKWVATFTRVSYSSDDGMENQFDYDSADPEQDTTELRNRIFNSMIGKTMTISTNPQGGIISLTGSSRLFDDMIAELNNMPGVEGLAASLKNAYGDSAMMESFSNIWGFYPQKPVKVGQKWQIKRSNTGMIAMSTNYTYTLKSRTEKQAVLASKSQVKTLPSAQLSLGFADIKYDMKGTGTGESVLTQPEGVLKKGTHTLSMTGMMYMTGSGFPKMDVPISTKSTVTIESIE